MKPPKIMDKNKLQELEDSIRNASPLELVSKLKEADFREYKKKKQILFIKDDIKKLHNTKIDYRKIIKYCFK